MSTLQIKQIEHQLATGQKTFSDKTIRVLLAEIYRLREQHPEQMTLAAPGGQAAEG